MKQPNIFESIVYFLLPRPFDFIFKGTIFWGIYGITIAILRFSNNLQLFFIALALFFVHDFLIKQATYIWNDIRDINSDLVHPHKNRRYIPKYSAIKQGKIFYFIRIILGVIFTIVIYIKYEIWWFPVIILGTLILQYLYDTWAKKRDSKRLIIAAVGYSERVIPAVLVIMWYKNYYDVILLILLTGWVISFAFVFLAAYWWAEKVFELRTNFAPKKSWFIENGQRVRKISSLVMFIFGAIITVIYSQLGNYLLFTNIFILFICNMLLLIYIKKPFDFKIRTCALVILAIISILLWIFGSTFIKWFIFVGIIPLYFNIMYSYISYEDINMISMTK